MTRSPTYAPRGAGLGLRHDLWEATLERADAIDFVEITIDDYLDFPLADVRERFEPVLERFEIVAHGIGLSVGTADGLDEAYLEKVARLLDALEIELYTEHLSFVRGIDRELGQFCPLPFTQQWAELAADRIERAQQIVGRPMALENISYLLGHPELELTEGEFIRRVTEAADCDILLDVTNLLVNASNHGYDPETFLDTIPGDRVVTGHLAGGHTDGDFYIDSHGHPLRDESLALLARAVDETALPSMVIERDKNFPDMRDLLDDVDRVRSILEDPDEAPRAPRLLPARRDPPPPPDLDVDAVAPSTLQESIAWVYEKQGRYRTIRETGAWPDGADYHPGDDERAVVDYLLSFPPAAVRAYGRILRYKRRENLEAVMPGTFRALDDDLPEVLDAYYEAHPDQGLGRTDDGLLFADFLLDDRDVDDPLRSLVRHEKTVLQLRSDPYRFWRFFSQRETIDLACHPRQLDAFRNGHDTDLALLPSPVEVRYKRKPEGVWIEVVS